MFSFILSLFLARPAAAAPASVACTMQEALSALELRTMIVTPPKANLQRDKGYLIRGDLVLAPLRNDGKTVCAIYRNDAGRDRAVLVLAADLSDHLPALPSDGLPEAPVGFWRAGELRLGLGVSGEHAFLSLEPTNGKCALAGEFQYSTSDVRQTLSKDRCIISTRVGWPSFLIVDFSGCKAAGVPTGELLLSRDDGDLSCFDKRPQCEKRLGHSDFQLVQRPEGLFHGKRRVFDDETGSCDNGFQRPMPVKFLAHVSNYELPKPTNPDDEGLADEDQSCNATHDENELVSAVGPFVTRVKATYGSFGCDGKSWRSMSLDLTDLRTEPKPVACFDGGELDTVMSKHRKAVDASGSESAAKPWNWRDHIDGAGANFAIGGYDPKTFKATLNFPTKELVFGKDDFLDAWEAEVTVAAACRGWFTPTPTNAPLFDTRVWISE